MSLKTAGEVAHKKFYESAGWCSLGFDLLESNVKTAWEDSANAVYERFNGRHETAVRVMKELLKQHEDNLALWSRGALDATEPDEQERKAVKRELRAAIDTVRLCLGLLCDTKPEDVNTEGVTVADPAEFNWEKRFDALIDRVNKIESERQSRVKAVMDLIYHPAQFDGVEKAIDLMWKKQKGQVTFRELLNNDASTKPNRARALHRVVRAMHDGNCPNCGGLFVADLMRNDNNDDMECPECKFKILDDDAEAALAEFAPYMKANLDEFVKFAVEQESKRKSESAGLDKQTFCYIGDYDAFCRLGLDFVHVPNDLSPKDFREWLRILKTGVWTNNREIVNLYDPTKVVIFEIDGHNTNYVRLSQAMSYLLARNRGVVVDSIGVNSSLERGDVTKIMKSLSDEDVALLVRELFELRGK